MLKKDSFILRIGLAALVLALASPAFAEWKDQYTAQGNNVGLTFKSYLDKYGFFGRQKHQFPRGSGNIITSSRWNWGINVLRDLDGDGIAEDTLKAGQRVDMFSWGRASLEYLNQLSAAAAAGDRMEQFASNIQSNRIWTSSDADDLAEWPAEFRAGRSSGGAPILNGAETVCTFTSDVFNNEVAVIGASLEYQFYFLNFAESNNMVYGHVFIRNMSECLKWNSNPQSAVIGEAAPSGHLWHEMQLAHVMYYITLGGGNRSWALYSPKGIFTIADDDGVENGWAGPVPTVSHMMLRPPSHNGETMEYTGTHTFGYNQSEYGFKVSVDFLQGSSIPSVGYHGGAGRTSGVPFHDGVNPWNGGVLYGWPGRLYPEDDLYESWIFGNKTGNLGYSFWAALHDFAPRDTTSADFVLMFVNPKNPPLVMPEAVVANIRNEQADYVQEQLSPILDYADIAEIVFNSDYVLPETPSAAPLTIIPGDRQVSITWSDVNIYTPDAYYAFLQENPTLDPNGRYKEFDFEGYRLYRSFVGPSDSHSELIMECSNSAGNVVYGYVDRWDDDTPFYRMSNGKKVWYALVPFDKNFDPVTGDAFSLPELTSGKIWNKPGATGLYTLLPRSNASNFRAPGVEGEIVFNPAYGTAISDKESKLQGNGDGTLAEAPKYMQPEVSLEFTSLIDEKITSAKTLTVTANIDSWKGYKLTGTVYNMMHFDLDDTGTAMPPSLDYDFRRIWGANSGSTVLGPPIHEDGQDYMISCDFNNMAKGSFRSDLLATINTGGYSGANAAIYGNQSRAERKPGYAPNNLPMSRSGRFTLTWASGGEGLTLSAKDLSRDFDLPFAEFIEDYGWGFVTLETFGGAFSGRGQFFEDMRNDVPQAERTAKMVGSLPADNTEEFGIYVNGNFWLFSGTDGVIGGMPSAGTVMTVDICYGYFNGDKTVFTQYNDPPWPGDKWVINVKPSTMDPEDADLSKVRVVPNPYLADSFLDLSSDSRRIEFVNLPDRCTIRIYSLGGHLVNVLNHIGANRHGWGDYTDWDRLDATSQPKEMTGYDNHGGTEPWNLRNRFGTTVASGLYFYHVTDSRGETHTGRFYVIN